MVTTMVGAVTAAGSFSWLLSSSAAVAVGGMETTAGAVVAVGVGVVATITAVAKPAGEAGRKPHFSCSDIGQAGERKESACQNSNKINRIFYTRESLSVSRDQISVWIS